MDYEKLHKNTLIRLQQMVSEGKITEEIARSICADFVNESEDERIKKALISHFCGIRDNCGKDWYGFNINDVIAWLERQNKQKPANKIESKFKVGDVMRTLEEAFDGCTDGMPVVVSIDEKYYHCTNELISIKNQDNYEYPPMNKRQNPAWSEEDEKLSHAIYESIDFLCLGFSEDKLCDWLKSIKERIKGGEK